MLKELINLWQNKGIMIQAIEKFGCMLEDNAILFKNSWELFKSSSFTEEEKQNLYTIDKRINETEREIRRLLVEHLSINPTNDASGCLALMSMVKDSERIGDYSKNIFDVRSVVSSNDYTVSKLEVLDKIFLDIYTPLNSLKNAFVKSDEKEAENIINEYQRNKDACSTILKELFTDEMSKQEALVTVLLSRYFKRINSHTCNIASGIIYPLDKIDFVKGGLLD